MLFSSGIIKSLYKSVLHVTRYRVAVQSYLSHRDLATVSINFDIRLLVTQRYRFIIIYASSICHVLRNQSACTPVAGSTALTTLFTK